MSRNRGNYPVSEAQSDKSGHQNSSSMQVWHLNKPLWAELYNLPVSECHPDVEGLPAPPPRNIREWRWSLSLIAWGIQTHSTQRARWAAYDWLLHTVSHLCHDSLISSWETMLRCGEYRMRRVSHVESIACGEYHMWRVSHVESTQGLFTSWDWPGQLILLGWFWSSAQHRLQFGRNGAVL